MHVVEIPLPFTDDTMKALFLYSVRASDRDMSSSADVVDVKYMASSSLAIYFHDCLISDGEIYLARIPN